MLHAALQLLYIAFIITCIFTNLQMTISATKELLHFIGTQEFVNEYGELFLILDKLNQDFVESFFSCQRQMCGGTQNMTAFVYGYNVNGYTTFQATKALANKQTNVYELKESMSYFNDKQHLPRRLSNDGIFDIVQWFVEL